MKRNMPIFLTQNKLLPTLYTYMIFAESICPILFACRDDASNVYICSCHCQNAAKREWIIAPTSYGKLIDLLTDKISIRDIFVQDNRSLYVATMFADASVAVSRADPLSLSDILPTAGYYMEADFDEFQEELEELRAECIKSAEFTETVIQDSFCMVVRSFPVHLSVPAAVSAAGSSNYLSSSHEDSCEVSIIIGCGV